MITEEEKDSLELQLLNQQASAKSVEIEIKKLDKKANTYRETLEGILSKIEETNNKLNKK